MFHQNSKIAQIYILWTLCCQVSEKLWRKPFKYYPGTFYMEFPLMFVFTLLIWELTLLLIWDHITNNSRIIFLFTRKSFVKFFLFNFIGNSPWNWSGTSNRKLYKRIPLNSDLGSFYKEFPCIFFYMEILCKIFPNFQTWNWILLP